MDLTALAGLLFSLFMFASEEQSTFPNGSRIFTRTLGTGITKSKDRVTKETNTVFMQPEGCSQRFFIYGFINIAEMDEINKWTLSACYCYNSREVEENSEKKVPMGEAH